MTPLPPPDPFVDALIALLPNLRRFALSLTRRPDLADDLVQITSERALAARPPADAVLRLAPWLFRILRNAFVDMTRRDRVRGPVIDLQDMADSLPPEMVVDGRALAETRLMLFAAQEAMETLPEEQRQVMILICQEELSYAEAAEVLDLPIGTVMSRLSRARLAVARRLGMK